MNQSAINYSLRESREKQPPRLEVPAWNRLPHDTVRNSRSQGISKGRSVTTTVHCVEAVLDVKEKQS